MVLVFQLFCKCWDGFLGSVGRIEERENTKRILLLRERILREY